MITARADLAGHVLLPVTRQGDGFSHLFQWPADPTVPYNASTNRVDISAWTFSAKLRHYRSAPTSVAFTVTQPTIGEVLLVLTGVQTASMQALKWEWDLQAKAGAADPETWLFGELPIIPKITRADT